jgi:hypothetical protein
MAWTRALRHVTSVRSVAGLAAAGVLGDLIVTGARRAVPQGAGRRLAVRAMAGGIVLTRRLETAAEEARLRAGDLVAEARSSLGEETPAPGAAGGEGLHEH